MVWDVLEWFGVRVTSFISSGTILKLLLWGILTFQIVMQKPALKNGMIPQKSALALLYLSS